MSTDTLTVDGIVLYDAIRFDGIHFSPPDS